jgi:hypothetical protein
MTPIVLLNQLREFVQDQTRDIILPVRPVKNKTTPEYREQNAVGCNPEARAPEVHLMRLPDKDAETNRVPYIVLQILKGSDTQAVGDIPASECKVRAAAVTYSDDAGLGMMSVLNVITRLRTALLRAGAVGQFLLKPGLEWIIYDSEFEPYHIGEMALTFELPEIIREV